VPHAGERHPAMAGDYKGGASPPFATSRTDRKAECPRPHGRSGQPPHRSHNRDRRSSTCGRYGQASRPRPRDAASCPSPIGRATPGRWQRTGRSRSSSDPACSTSPGATRRSSARSSARSRRRAISDFRFQNAIGNRQSAMLACSRCRIGSNASSFTEMPIFIRDGRTAMRIWPRRALSTDFTDSHRQEPTRSWA